MHVRSAPQSQATFGEGTTAFVAQQQGQGGAETGG